MGMATTSRLPYITAYGNIAKGLEKIKKAKTPDRFSQDFLENTLAMKGGSSRPLIPFLKRTGFLADDGAPTDLYKRFRNPDYSRRAAAEALKIGYAPLFEADEEIYKRDAPKLKGQIVQVTGMDSDAGVVTTIVKSFEALKAFGDFTVLPDDDDADEGSDQDDSADGDGDGGSGDLILPQKGINLGYTINLHLPATSDVGVYNAIFRSLRENLLRDLG
jgi:hypothetical protein